MARLLTPYSAASLSLSTPTASGPRPSPMKLFTKIISAVYLGPVLAMLQAQVQPGMRAQATALMIFVNNFIGLGLGPLAVGVLSDKLAAEYGARSLAIALTLLSLLSFWAAFHYLISARRLGDSVLAGESSPQA